MPSVRVPEKVSKPPTNSKKLNKATKRKREEDELTSLTQRIANYVRFSVRHV